MATADPAAHAADEPQPVALPEERASKWAEYKSEAKWATSLLLLAILGLSGWLNEAWQTTPAGRENLSRLVESFLAETPGGGEIQLVFLLQLLGILLVAALVGSLVLAMKDRPEAPETDEEAH